MDIKSFYPIIIIAALILVFTLLRNINLWYWKIDENISNQKKIIDLLEKLNDKKQI